MIIKGLRKAVTTVNPYVPGKSIEEVKRELGLKDIIKIASNENNYAPFPKVLKAMERELVNLNRYTDVTFKEIKRLLGELYGACPENFAMSHGAEGMLQTLCKCFIEEGDEIILPAVTYGLYKEISRLMAGIIVEVPMVNHTADLQGIINAFTPKTKLIWLSNPNNPTGTIFPKEQFPGLLDALPDQAWVVLDEAYAEFAPFEALPDRVSLINAGKRIIVTRTFSKAYGLAGARLGYAMAHPDMITIIDTASEPFNANRIALAGAISVLTEDQEACHEALSNIIQDRQRLEHILSEMGMKVVPSSANFVFFETPYNAQLLFRDLLRRGIIVRPCTSWGYPNTLRVTVGTTEQIDRFLETFEDVLRIQEGRSSVEDEEIQSDVFDRLDL